MPDLTAKRTLVKSPPELWEELSEVERLARHLGAFGDIRITRLEPERTVAWEGERASGTVSIEPSGWGTKVVLTADLDEEEDPPGVVAGAEPADGAESAGERAEPASAVGGGEEPRSELAEPHGGLAAPPSRWRAFWARLFSGWLVPEERLNPATAGSRQASKEIPAPGPRITAVGAADLEREDEPPVEPEVGAPAPSPTSAIDPERAEAVLQEALDALGSAHHRPFSRG
jgi:hypothetical protein